MKRQRLRVRPRLLKDNDSCANSKSLSSTSVGATVIGKATVTTPEGRFLEKTVTFSREALEHYCFQEREVLLPLLKLAVLLSKGSLR